MPSIFFILFFVVSVTNVMATNYYVNDASLVGDVYCKAIGNTMNDGLSPLKPKASLKQLYTTYNQFADGDTIYMDAGTYLNEYGFSFSKSITILGAGSSKTVINLNKTAYSGDYSFAKIQGSVTIKDLQLINFFARSTADNVGQCLTFISTGLNRATLSNVIISNGNGVQSGYSSILILSNCKVTLDGNQTGSINCAKANTGGGIDVDGKGIDLQISNYKFIGNEKNSSFSQLNGSAISINNADATTNVTILNSIFKNNSGTYASAIFANSGNLNITDCIFSSNSSTSVDMYYGGVLAFEGGIQKIIRSSFNDNSSSMYTRGTIANNGGNLSISDCSFSGNKASNATDVCSKKGASTISNSTFSSTGTNIYNYGGTITISDCGNPTRSGTITLTNSNSPSTFITPTTPTYTGDCSTGINVPCPNTLEYATYTSTCTSGTLSPTTFSPLGGIFNTSEGLDLNKTTGEINYATSISGTYSITYFVGGCSVSKTLNFGAGSLSGNQAICEGTTTTFASTLAGGIWSSSNNGIASVNSSGLVTAIGIGTATIYYTVVGVQGCADAVASRTVTITAKPNAGTISGTTTLCDGKTSQLVSTATGGSWTSSATAIATINATSGLLSGVTVGSSTVTYTVLGTGGCSNATATTSITINGAASVGVLSGSQTICLAGTNTFTSTVAGGTWSSGDPSIATINSSTGLITNIKAGTVTMTYTQAGVNGCPARTATQTLTITTSPSAGVISGNTSVCTGTTSTLTSNLLGGSWSSATTTVATVNASTGVVTPVAAGSSVITYTIPTTGGCAAASATKTINLLTSPTITGSTPVSRCDAGTLTLGATASSGTISWFAASTGGASLASGTSFTTPSISSSTTFYVEVTSGSCVSTSRTAVKATVIPTPKITGITDGTRCDAGTVILGATASSDTINWYSTAIGGNKLGSGSSFITPSILKTTTYYVDARYGGCATNVRTAVTASISANIPTITGVSNVCVGSTTNLTGSSTAHVTTPWTSSNPTVASITNTGIVHGVAAGTSVITYMNSTGCINTFTVIVNSTDSATFTYGQSSYCSTLDANPIPTISGTKGGTFTSNSTGLIIDKNTGVISLVNSNTGTYIVIYTANGNCSNTASSSTSISIGSSPTVNPLVDQSICSGSTINAINFLGSLGSVFEWTNSNTSIGLAASGSGNISSFVGKNISNLPISSSITVIPKSGSCVGVSKTFKITVNPTESASFSYSSTNYCPSEADPIPVISGVSGGVFSVSPAGLSIDQTTGKISLAKSSKGNYAVIYKTSGLCMSEMQWDINIDTNPSSKLSIVSETGKNIFCMGDSLKLIAQGASNYLWNTGQTVDFITVKTPGKYTVSSKDGGCTSSFSYDVTVDTFSVNMSIPSMVLLHGGSVSLHGYPIEGTFSGLGVKNNTLDPISSGLGTKKITFKYVSPNNCSALLQQNIIVYDTVFTNCTITKYDTVTVTNNVTKYDTITITKNVTKYDTVTVKNNVYDTIIVTNKVTKYDTLIVKQVKYDTLTITNKVTKYDTITVKNNVYDTIKVIKYDTITRTDTVSILKIKFKLTTGIYANQITSMSLYPNPTTDVLKIEVGDAKALEGYRYRILDALGKEVYNELVKNTLTEIPLKTIGAAGMYLFEVLDQKNSSIQSNKIVLQ